MKLNIKKMISSVIVFAMLAAMLPQIAFAADITWDARTNPVDLRVGILADSHVTSADNVHEFNRPIKAFSQIDANMDAVLLTGDIIYGAESAQQSHFENCYDIIKDNYDNYFDPAKTPMLYAMGNHEIPLNGKDDKAEFAYEAFKNKIGELNQTNVINGYTFITAAPQDYFGVLTPETEEYIMSAANAAIAKDANKPVFLAIHHPTNDQYGTNNSCYSDTFYEWLHSTPQMVMFTAHTHNTGQSPSIIKQVEGGYTVVCVPFSGNSKYNFRSGGVTAVLDDVKKADSRYDWNCARESILLEAKGNKVKIFVMDALNGRYVGDPYEIDIPALVAGTGYKYTDERFEKSTGPEFPANAELTVTEDSENQGTIKVEFSNNAVKDEESQPGYQDDFVFGYRINVEDKLGGYVLKSVVVAGEFYLPEEKHSAALATTFDGLEAGKTYTISVAPVSAFLAEGKALRKEITISGERATYTKLAEWTLRADSAVTKNIDGTDYRVIENNIDKEKYPINLQKDSLYQHELLPIDDAVYSQLYYTEPFSKGNPVYGHYPVINSGNLAASLNDGFTIDSWVNIKRTGQTKLFGVYDYNAETKKYTPKFQIAFDPSDTNGGIKIERQTTDGTNTTKVSKFAGRINYAEWHHISAAVSKAGEVPVLTFYIDGEKKSLSTLSAYNTASATDTAVEFDTDDMVVFAGPGSWADASATRISDSAIYSDQLPEGAVIDNYYKHAGDFDHIFDVKIENTSGTVIPYSSLKTIKKDDVKRITVDLSGTANVSKDNFEIYNVTDGNTVGFNYRVDGTTAVIAGFELEENKSYKLTVRNIKDAEGNLMRCTNQVLEFATATSKYNYTKLAEWTPRANSLVSKTVDGKTYTIIENNADSEKGMIDYQASTNNTLYPISDNIYEEIYRTQPISGSYSYHPILKSSYMPPAMNDGFTFESWVNLNETSGGANHLLNVYSSSANTETLKRQPKLRLSYNQYGQITLTRQTKSEDDTYVNAYKQTTSGMHAVAKWCHLAITVKNVEGGTEFTIYRDGVNKGTFKLEGDFVELTADDIVVLGASDRWLHSLKTRFSDTAIYDEIVEGGYIKERYDDSFVNYEAKFNTELCDADGNVYQIGDIKNLNAEKVSSFKVDLTADAAATKDNFEIYCKNTADSVDFNLSNEGSVYTLSGFELNDDMDYQFIVKNVVKSADGTTFRTSPQVLNVKTVTPAIRNKLAEWIPDKIVNQKIANTVDESNSLNVQSWSEIKSIHSAEYSKVNYIFSDVIAKYNIDNGGALAAKMNNGFTFETWVQLGDTNWSVDNCARLMAVTDDDGKVKFEIRYYPQSTSYPKSLTIARYGENGSSVELEGCKWDGEATRLLFANWYHIVVTVGSNGENGTLNDIKLYVNGAEKELTGTPTGTGTPLVFEESDLMYLAGPNTGDARNRTKFSNTTIYGGKIQAADALERYSESLPYYETMFGSKLYNTRGNVITLEGVGSVLSSNCGNFTVDVTETAANVTEANFEIYNVTDNATVEFTLSNEGTVYTLSGFTLEGEKDYQFIIKDIADAEGNLIRTTDQVLDIHTVAVSDMKITEASVAKDGTVSATVTNLADSAKPAVFIVASYNSDDVLLKVDYFDIGTLESGDTFTPETIDVQGGKGITVKFMLWEDVEDIIPYHEAIVK